MDSFKDPSKGKKPILLISAPIFGVQGLGFKRFRGLGKQFKGVARFFL